MKDIDLSGVINLMQIQNDYINQVYKIIYVLYTDLNVANNAEFQKFTVHFNSFMQNHARSEGFSKATEISQHNYVLLEKLIDGEILSTAEQLEFAVGHLETAIKEPKIRTNMQVLLLNQGIMLLEETQLKIIENVEGLLENFRKTQLQN
ncbi:hypothetical protein [Dendrosporobacter sp. 1207_IL3150]|uniref:hypothetical protein n=1 Tax=Dendrosporobacter sp. 1207_IL3150 TaxID=3084054 RepID=UPI002FD91A70